MDAAAHVEQLERDGTLLATAATAADWDAPVPGIAWTLREVVVHTGAVHRWCADIVRRRLTRNETGGSSAFQPEPSDDDATLGWYADGLTALLSTLSDAPDDAEVWAFGRSAPARAFWSRRQAHETAIHRGDVEAAAGRRVSDVGAGFAQDGLAELVGGFARGFPGGSPGRLALVADDGDDWLVTFDGEGVVGTRSDDVTGADARVNGSSSDLYRWAWNRPAPVTVAGDRAVAELWRRVRIT